MTMEMDIEITSPEHGVDVLDMVATYREGGQNLCV